MFSYFSKIQKNELFLGGYFVFLSVLFVFHFHLIGTFISDDAFITFRYSQNLAEHGQAVYNLGYPVEGYSNFLWMLLLAFFAKLGFSISSSALTIEFLSAIALLFLVLRYICLLTEFFERSERVKYILYFTPVLLVLWAPFVVWTSGGLETVTFSLLLFSGVFIFSFYEADNLKFILFSLIWIPVFLIRPEGIALFALIWTVKAVFLFFKYGFNFKKYRFFFVSSVLIAFIYILFSVWRIIYYGDFYPNTYYVKIYGIPYNFLFKHGFIYLKSFLNAYNLNIYMFLFTGAVFLPSEIRKKLIYVFVIIVFWMLYTVRIGGDFMAMHRHAVPMLPLISISLFTGIVGFSYKLLNILKKFDFKFKRYIPFSLALFASLFVTIDIARLSFLYEKQSLVSEKTVFGAESIRGMKNFADDRIKIGRILLEVLGENTMSELTMAVGGAGAIVYESRIGQVIDTFGLNDKTIARKKITPGKFYKSGHLKIASWSYIKRKTPDIICSPGVARMGISPPSVAVRRKVTNYFRNYEYFCIVSKFSSFNHGAKHRTHYCCLKAKGTLPELTLHTTGKKHEAE